MTAKQLHIGLIKIVIFGFVFLLFSCDDKKKTDWSISYVRKHKKPFGTYVLFEELKTLFPGQETTVLKSNPYDYFDSNYNFYDNSYSINGNYICIDRYMFTIDQEASEEILNYISHGNSAFIAANAFSETFKDSLNFNLENEVLQYDLVNNNQETPAKLSFTNKELSSKEYNIDKKVINTYFKDIDSSTTTVLGYQEINGKKYPNFIKVNHVNGYFYLHSQPISFTNYYVLNNQEYSAKVFSYLPDRDLLWDPHKRYRKDSDDYENTSPLKFFLSHKSLKWAFILAVIGLLFYILFNAKRKQRIIPIIKPIKNTTVDFTHTIGNLYHQQKNHGDIIQRKIVFFLEKIRSTYFIDTHNLNTEFIEKLSSKSGKPVGQVKLLVNTIKRLNNNHSHTEDDLLRLNELIEKFFTS